MFQLTSCLLVAAMAASAMSLSAAPANAAFISFVSSKGANTGDCSSAASPCETLQYAVSKTALGGEIKILDAGNFAQVTISKSISITGVPGAGIVRGTAGAAIVINARSTDRVNITGLTIDGVKKIASSAIMFQSGAYLLIKNCVIRNFGYTAILINVSTNATFTIEDTFISNSGNDGISVAGAAATATGVVNRVTSVGNSTGMRVFPGGIVSVSDSVFANNASDGILVGLTSGAGGLVRVTGSTLTGSVTGLRVVSGGAAESAGDNFIRGNSSANISGTVTNVGRL